MTEAAEKLMPSLLALPVADRLDLVVALQHSLGYGVDESAEIDPALLAELDRRRADHESGRVKSIPAEEFFRRLREERA